MAPQFEFSLYTLSGEEAKRGDVSPTLALLGTQGWEMRGLSTLADGSLVIALQRSLAADPPLPDEHTLSAALAEPLAPPVLEMPEVADRGK